jgi:hypothetical protein
MPIPKITKETTMSTNEPNKTPSASAAPEADRPQAHPLVAALIGGTALGVILIVVTALFQRMGWFH